MSANDGLMYYNRRGQVFRGPYVKCADVDDGRDFYSLRKGRQGMIDVTVVLAKPVGAFVVLCHLSEGILLHFFFLLLQNQAKTTIKYVGAFHLSRKSSLP